MTNSEAIEQLKFLKKVDFHIDTKEACDIAIDLFQENDKLKAEISNIRINLDATYKKLHDATECCREYQEKIKLMENIKNSWIDGCYGLNDKLKKYELEIEQLKSELEQSVIPCIHGYDKRQNEIGETLIFCEYTDNWMNVTLGECIGNCEAEERSGIK